MNICDYCEDGECDFCILGNPCYGCVDYDEDKHECTSEGACGEGG